MTNFWLHHEPNSWPNIMKFSPDFQERMSFRVILVLCKRSNMIDDDVITNSKISDFSDVLQKQPMRLCKKQGFAHSLVHLVLKGSL